MFKKLSVFSNFDFKETSESNVVRGLHYSSSTGDVVRYDAAQKIEKIGKNREVGKLNDVIPYNEIDKVFQREIGSRNYEKWFNQLIFEIAKNGALVLKIPAEFVREFNLNSCLRKIRSLILDKCNEVNNVDIRIYSNENYQSHLDSKIDSANTDGGASAIQAPSTNSYLSQNGVADAKSVSCLNSAFTFENFVYGDSNKAAYFSLKQIADFAKNAEDCSYSLNLLKSVYIHAAVGMGKTHLIQALANSLNNQKSNLNVYYCTAENFMYHYVQSVRTNCFVKFKSEFTKVDILILDDLQLIAGRNSTEKEFFSIFDAMLASSKTVIIASDLLPHQINLSDRGKSRLSGSLILSILDPDPDLKFRILKNKLQSMTNSSTSAYITDSMLELIVSSVNSSIRELEGMLHKVITYCDLMGLRVNDDLVKKIIQNEYGLDVLQSTNLEYVNKKSEPITVNSSIDVKNSKKGRTESSRSSTKNDISNTSQVTSLLDKIVSTVSQYYKISIDDIISKKRSKALSTARQIITHISREFSGVNYSHIGEYLGDRDHSTIVHMSKVVKSCKNKVLLNDILTIKSILSPK